ncbi:MAG TPA: DoxX family protein [Candidatus Paceibacterota bacterium]|nr:DoxX family protein [Candidatus Paceibacterota bacterium]
MQPAIRRVSKIFYNRSAGLLLVRVAAGSIFLSHGYQKIADMSATIMLFDTLGFSPLIAIFIAWLEILGGVALILGIAPRVFAGVLGIEMIIAALLISGGSMFAAAEFELLLAATMIGVVLIGSGRYALYTMECDKCSGLFCIKKNGVCVVSA